MSVKATAKPWCFGIAVGDACQWWLPRCRFPGPVGFSGNRKPSHCWEKSCFSMFLSYSFWSPFNRHVDFKRKMWERWVGWTMMRSQRSEVCSAQRVCHWCYARGPIDVVIWGLRAEVWYVHTQTHTYIQTGRQTYILCVYMHSLNTAFANIGIIHG